MTASAKQTYIELYIRTDVQSDLSKYPCKMVASNTHNRLSVDEIGSHSILIDTESGKYRSRPGIDLQSTIGDYTDDHLSSVRLSVSCAYLLPALFAPSLGFGSGA
jgi:hypothetical protein